LIQIPETREILQWRSEGQKGRIAPGDNQNGAAKMGW